MPKFFLSTSAACVAALLCGCAGGGPRAFHANHARNVVVSGKPPMMFVLSQPGELSVFDDTVASKIFYAQVTPEMAASPTLFTLDAKSKALIAGSSPGSSTQPTVEQLLSIDPDHHYTVVFVPTTYGSTAEADAPGTQPAAEYRPTH
ncbi:MAG TPA: hypothetical protein VF624_02355 [Tepidisphaeraceae bacterium]